MTERSTQNSTFEIEHVYESTAAQVFRAWSDLESRTRWFGPRGSDNVLSLDFRVGGREHFKDTMPGGMIFGYDARYHEIVTDCRIVYAYTVDFDQTRISASLVTVDITPVGSQTRQRYTEQAVFFDGGDTPADREHGTRAELDELGRALQADRIM